MANNEIDVVFEKCNAIEKIFTQYQSHVAEHIRRHEEEIEDLYKKNNELAVVVNNLNSTLITHKGELKVEINSMESRIMQGVQTAFNKRNKNWQNWIIVIIQILTFIMIYVKQ